MDIRLKNYEAIKQADIHVEGTTCIISKNNNQGKTSFTRAIASIIEARIGEERVNSDPETKECNINLFVKGNNLILKREKKGTTEIEYNQKPYKALGSNTVINDIAPELGFIYENIKGEKVMPQVTFPKTQPFPFLFSDSVVYSIFSKFFGTDQLENITNDIKKNDLPKLKKELSNTESTMDLRTQDLVKIKKKIEIYPEKSSLIEYQKSLQNNIEKYRILIEADKLIIRKIELSNHIIKINECISIIPDISSIRNNLISLQNRLSEMRSLNDRIKKYSGSIEIINKQISIIPDLSEFKNKLNEHKKRISGLKQISDSLKLNTKKIEECNQEIDIVNKQIEEKRKDYLSNFDDCPLCKSKKENWNI